MANVTVIGAQWGDEGKGKVIDWLANRAEVVVRFQGGNNAGHTIVVGDKTYKLSLLPSGVIQGKLSIIGNGVVVDPWSLLDEIARAQGQGLDINPDNLVLAENATLVLPLHRDLDGAREARAGAGKIGTTGRGIGPAYEDKVGRRAIRFADLADREALAVKIERLLAHHGALRAGLGCRKRSPKTSLRSSKSWRPGSCPSSNRPGACWGMRSRTVSGSCSKAPRPRCSMSIMAPIPMSPRPTRWRARRRRAPASAPPPAATSWAS